MKGDYITNLSNLSSDRKELSKEEAQGRSSGEKARGRRLIGGVLSKAVQLWLRSQVEAVAQLQVKISAGDRQILQGTIPEVSIQTAGAVYQGLHLSDLELSAAGIHVNLAEVVRGKPLRLLAPVEAIATLQLAIADLNASLQSALLANALSELLTSKLAIAGLLDGKSTLHCDRAAILPDTDTLILSGTLHSSGNPTAFQLQTRLQLLSPQELQFINPAIQIFPDSALTPLDNFILYLGTDVAIAELTLTENGLRCQGKIVVRSEE